TSNKSGALDNRSVTDDGARGHESGRRNDGHEALYPIMRRKPLANAREIDRQHRLQRRVAISQRWPGLVRPEIRYQSVFRAGRLIEESQQFELCLRSEQIENVGL